MGAHGLLGEDVPEELAAGGEDDLVRAQVVRVGLVVVGGEGAVEELAVVPDPGEGPGHVGLEVVPPEAELLRGAHVEVVEGGLLNWIMISFVLYYKRIRLYFRISFNCDVNVSKARFLLCRSY